jgi:chromosome partitioning protein
MLPAEANYCLNCGTPTGRQAPDGEVPGKSSASHRHIARIFAIVNQRCSVGKTTTAVNLGAYLANAGRKTLVVDLDPSSDTTTSLGFEAHETGPEGAPPTPSSDPRKVNESIYELLVDEQTNPAMVIKPHPDLQNLYLLPSKVDMYAADVELLYMEDRERRLRHILHGLKDQFDFILIDCPSGLGLLTINGLSAYPNNPAARNAIKPHAKCRNAR